jgi:CRISPR-associated protein Cst2
LLHLGENRVKEAQGMGLAHDEQTKTYGRPIEQRRERVAPLLTGLAHLEGGANQTLHYTDVSPAVIIAAVTKGGNHPFAHCIGPDAKGLPKVNTEALDEAIKVLGDQLLSPVYIGWTTGFHDGERTRVAQWAEALAGDPEVVIDHPKLCIGRIAKDIQEADNAKWFER